MHREATLTRDDRRGLTREPVIGALGQLAMLALLARFGGLDLIGLLAGDGYAVVLCATLVVALRRCGLRALRPADHVTLVRATLTGCVTAIVAGSFASHAPTTVGPLVAFTAAALVLDGVDGQVARRTGTASPFGARFDMEVDAFLILVLSVLVARSLGGWVLLIGAMRYVFVLVGRALPWLTAALPPSRARKAVAALQGIALTVVAAGVLPRPGQAALAALALAALLWSFGRDVLLLHRRRPVPGRAAAPRPPRPRATPRTGPGRKLAPGAAAAGGTGLPVSAARHGRPDR